MRLLDNRPIGVFDSGLGGLTAVKELQKILPCEDIVYFGDTGRVPYGTKGSDTIMKYTAQDIRLLLSFNVKAIIIACGTMSSVAFPQAVAVAAPVPVIGVVCPTVNAALSATRNNRIGILGTSATIRSGSYEEEILQKKPQAEVFPQACPLFVPLVENGYFKKDDPLATLAATDYLRAYEGTGIDTMIMGCTHYPLLQGVIASIMGDGVTLIDPGKETARVAESLLRNSDLLAEDNRQGVCRFYVSDCTDDFTRLAGVFLEQKVSGYVEKIDIEKY